MSKPDREVFAEASERECTVVPGSGLEIFTAFLLLGLTSFGGPIAHLGYFRQEFVERRRWLTDKAYADLVALCQFLPGPASSQVGFALGLRRGGVRGGLLAWLAFTLPSALLLVAFAMGASLFHGPVGEGLLSGLKIVAVAIVAHAVWGMSSKLCPDPTRAGIALAALLLVLLAGTPLAQVGAIGLGAVAGLILCRRLPIAEAGGENAGAVVRSRQTGRTLGVLAGGLFIVLLLLLPVLAQLSDQQGFRLADAFYRAGALVFGGGHVVLPLLEAEVVKSGWVSADAFLAGYGAAQAVPGPLFTFAAYLGAVGADSPNALSGAGIALVMIFLPGMLVLLAVLPVWNRVSAWRSVQAALHGVNAAVVGLLGAVLYHPVWTGSITGVKEFALALTCFFLLTVWRCPAWLVVIVAAGGGVLVSNV